MDGTLKTKENGLVKMESPNIPTIEKLIGPEVSLQ